MCSAKCRFFTPRADGFHGRHRACWRTFGDWFDEERIVVNVNTLYQEFSGEKLDGKVDELHERMLR